MEIIKKIFIYAALIIVAIIVLFPFLWMILTSLKTLSETLSVEPNFFPADPQFSNYSEALDQADYVQYFINSVVVAVISTLLVLVTTVLGAFALSKYDFKFKKIIVSVMLATLMIPGEMLIITNYNTIANMGLIDTRAALIIPFMTSVFYIYMTTQFFATIPNSLYLAAKVDGVSDFRYLLKVVVPISKPILFTVMLLNAIGSWNAFLWPSLVINSADKRTLPFGLVTYASEAGTNYHLLMAASTIVIIPILILFIFTRKYVIGGLTKGAVKG